MGANVARYPAAPGHVQPRLLQAAAMPGDVRPCPATDRACMAFSFGYGPDGQTWRRYKVSGRTRAEVAEKLRQLQAEQDSGVQPERGYTVQRAVDDWLAEGLDGRSAGTVALYRNILKPVTPRSSVTSSCGS